MIALATIASGRSRATYAAVVGNVTQVTHELDGDYHIRIEGKGAFLVAEIQPEFPLVPPPTSDRRSPPGGSSATTACTTGGSCTR